MIKPAEQTPLSIALLGPLALEAGIPEGVVNYVTGYGEEAGEALVRHPGVDKISFTGSSETGKLIVRGADRHAQARVARARRQVAEHRLRRRRCSQPRSPAPAWPSSPARARTASPASRLYVHKRRLRRRRRRDRRPREVDAPRARARHRDADGPAGLARAARPRPRLHRRSDAPRASRSSTGGGRWGDAGYFVEPTVMVNASSRDAGRPRGDIRPGASGDPVHERGGGARGGQ